MTDAQQMLEAPIAASSGGSAVSAHRAGGSSRPRMFSFGDPEPVLERRELWSYAECWNNGRWYEAPVPMRALARAYDMSPHLRSAIIYKRNQLLRHFKPSRWLDRRNFGEFVLNFLHMGNAYLEERRNVLGAPLKLRNSPALFTRVGVEPGRYWWVPGNQPGAAFEGRVAHVFEPELRQEVYGIPEWTSALQSGLLNFDATIFRRKYYHNGSHMGFILYVASAELSDEDADAIEAALEEAKGAGNFKNMLLHIPDGKEKGVQLLPVGETAAKDEFFNIKNVTRDDILAAERVPPVLIAVVPQVNGGFGKPAEAADVFYDAEIVPLQMRMLEVNDQLGYEAIAFEPYVKLATAANDDRASSAAA